MQQTDQAFQITPYQPSTDSQLVKVGDRVYSITEVQLTALQPRPVAPYPNGFWDAFKWLAVGLVGMGFFGFLAYSITSLFLPRSVPVATPAPAPAPPIVIVQPPVEKKPFSRRDCRADGAFGWGQSCIEERGYE